MLQVVRHFGEPLRAHEHGHRLAREFYALPDKKRSIRGGYEFDYTPEMWAIEAEGFDDDQHTIYKDEHVAYLRSRALKNFDSVMQRLAAIDSLKFEKTLQSVLAAYPVLQPVDELAQFKNVTGVYVMVLDGVHQVYVGETVNIRTRIMQHWSGRIPLDRLIFGDGETSKLAINSFRPLDTTRIYAGATTNRFDFEAGIVKAFPEEFRLNRIDGGENGGRYFKR
jgi:hypothetical protein